jgi:hypothetical protein
VCLVKVSSTAEGLLLPSLTQYYYAGSHYYTVGILMITPSFIQAMYVHNYNKEKYDKKVDKGKQQASCHSAPQCQRPGLKIREISRTSRISKPQRNKSQWLRILHLRRTPIPSKLRSRPQLHLLLLLDQCTASTPEGDTAVSRTGSRNAMLLAHFTPPNRLNDPLAVSHSENSENGALQASLDW